MRIRILTLCSLLLVALSPQTMSGKGTALKTNVLYDATGTVNLGLEQVVAPRWSVDLSANLNAWNMHDGARWKHWMVQPEARYWFCQALDGHFVAAHLLGGQYNVGNWTDGGIWGIRVPKLRDNRYQGWYAGIGVGYGYAWALSSHWNLEAEIALGYMFTRFDRFECKDCGREVDSNVSRHRFGPTKAAISLVYVF